MVFAVLGVSLTIGAESGEAAGPSAPAGAPRNFIVILTDDQRDDTINLPIPGTTFDPMPILRQQLIQKGIRFKNSFVNTSLCCPSRASLLTGQYANRTGIYNVDWTRFGIAGFDDTSTIATWLDPTFQTAFLGKYLNNYNGKYWYNPATAKYESIVDDPPTGKYFAQKSIPPGWNYWSAFVPPQRITATSTYTHLTPTSTRGPSLPGMYYDAYSEANLNVNLALEQYSGTDSANYSTDVLADKAVSFINQNASQPFFMVYAPVAPHSSNMNADDYYDLPEIADDDLATYQARDYDNLPKWWQQSATNSFNEGANADKPDWAAGLGQLGDVDKQAISDFRERQYGSLLAVDRAIGDIVNALNQNGLLQNTMIIDTSDNGYLWGEHRMTSKLVPYEESIRVPFVVRYDPWTANLTDHTNSDMVANVDIATTIAALSGLSPTNLRASGLNTFSSNNVLSGLNLEPELNPASKGTKPVRKQMLIEASDFWSPYPPAFCAIRTGTGAANPNFMYADYAGGGRHKELYDMRATAANDVWQLSSKVEDASYNTIQQSLHSALFSGSGRLCNPYPPGFTTP